MPRYKSDFRALSRAMDKKKLEEAKMSKKTAKAVAEKTPEMKTKPAKTKGSTVLSSRVPFSVGQVVWIPSGTSNDKYAKGKVKELRTAIKLGDSGQSIHEDKVVISFKKQDRYGSTQTQKTFTLEDAKSKIATSEPEVKLIIVKAKIYNLDKAFNTYKTKYDKQKAELEKEMGAVELELSRQGITNKEAPEDAPVMKSGKKFAHIDVG